MEDQSIFGSLCSNSASVRNATTLAGNDRSCFLFSLLFLRVLVFLFDDAYMNVCISDEVNMLNIIDYFLNASGHLYINDIQGYSIYRKLYHFSITPPKHRVQKKLRPTTPEQMNNLDKVGEQTDNSHYQLYRGLRDRSTTGFRGCGGRRFFAIDIVSAGSFQAIG